MVSPELALKVQRLIDEYVGAVGSAAIVSRTGEVLFHSEHDDSACGLALAANYALDGGYVLVVVTMPGVSSNAITTRMKKGAHLLRRVLRAGGRCVTATRG